MLSLVISKPSATTIDEHGLPSPANSAAGSPVQMTDKSQLNHFKRLATPEPEEDDEKTVQAPRKCNYCGATSTPMWRHGPGEYTNLCNSCGVKWRRGKILSSGENRHHLCKSSAKRKSSCEKTVKKKVKSPVARQLWTPSYSEDDEDEEEDLPVKNNNLAVLTNEFAAMLEKLTPQKTVLFTAALARCFEPKMAQAYQAGHEVEMSVLDISSDTWTTLRAIVSTP
jgi:hypothetical protein